jgi:lysophospholipase L1-like esterase
VPNSLERNLLIFCYLRSYALRQKTDPTKHDVHLYGVGGRTIAKIYYNDLKVVRRKRPDAVFLQVGGNDILKDSSPTLILVKMKRLVSPP